MVPGTAALALVDIVCKILYFSEILFDLYE